MSIELPKLPIEPSHYAGFGRVIRTGYTAEMMRAFGQEAARLTLEAAARECDDQGEAHTMFKNTQAAIGCDGCADAIRALIASAPGEGKGK